MYTSHIGKKAVEHYNEVNSTSLTVKEYFENILFPLFYDHPNYLQSPANTPLFQLIAQKRTSIPEERQKKLEEINSKIQNFADSFESYPDMSFAIGYASAGDTGTTSGQITSLNLPLSSDDMYASWIGAAFGIGIKGGYNLLTENPMIFNAIQQGWNVYRNFVQQTPAIGNKVESWNGVWLQHCFSEEYSAENPLANFNPLTKVKNSLIIDRCTWLQMLFTFARIMQNAPITAYLYSLGQMNKTIGFIQIKLPEINKFHEFFDELFGKKSGISNKRLTELYETQYGLNIACERFGMLGLRAIEPKDLIKYMPSRNSFSSLKFKSDNESLIKYLIYITWVVAMLNDKNLYELAEKVASNLKEFLSAERRARTNRTSLVKEFLDSKNRKDFISKITKIVEEDKSLSQLGNELVEKIMLEIAPDQVALFITLIRFKYISNNKI